MSILNLEKKITPILKMYGISHAAVFGSVARGEDTPLSDVDLLVSLGKPMGMFRYMEFIEKLEDALQKKVDVVTRTSIGDVFAKSIAHDLKTIYEG